MNRRFFQWLLVVVGLLAFPFSSPAPFIYRPGEGWSYEPVGGGGQWRRQRAKDQLEVAQAAFDKKDYNLALKAARRVVHEFGLPERRRSMTISAFFGLAREFGMSDYAPQAQYLVGRCYEAKGNYERAFQEYQNLLQKYPKIANYQEVIRRQYDIANLYLAGKWFRLWGVMPFRSMDRVADMYDKVVKNGPYSDVAPQAQLNIGAARERQSNFALAVKAYELAADRYNDRPQFAADALYHAGVAYDKQAKTAEYDQTTAGQAIATLTDFTNTYPNDLRVVGSQKIVASLKTEQARGNFQTARFYEKYKKWKGAVVYYNEVLLQDPNSPYATEARQRIDALKPRTQTASQ